MDAEISANKTLQQQISNSLLLNASFIDNLGLMNGKMGISIYFYHLARRTRNKIYEDYAGELIDEIYDGITINTSAGFENGLAGIGWGIEYLVQNNFIEAETDEVLEEFDNRIFKELIYNTPKEIGLLNGLIGLGSYFLKRIPPACRQGRNPASNDEKITVLTNKQALIHVIDELDRKTQNNPEIIREPSMTSNKKQQTTNNKQRTTELPTTNKIFDITWDYPVLLWFLAELNEQNIFNFKVEKIIQRLIEPLLKETNYPVLHSNQLLLALSLNKLQQIHKPHTPNQSQIIVEQSNFQPFDPSDLQPIIDNLFSGIKRNTINYELPKNNVTTKCGTSGMAWVYHQLHRQEGGSHFKEGMEYWYNQSFVVGGIDNFSGTGFNNRNVWGVLEGVAGLLLTSEITNITKRI